MKDRRQKRTPGVVTLFITMLIVLAALVMARGDDETPASTGSPATTQPAQETAVIAPETPSLAEQSALILSPEVTLTSEEHFDEVTDPDFHGYEQLWRPLDEIPLSDELQQAVFDASELYGADMALLLGMIECESTFQPEARSGQCWGLMQIHSVNYVWLLEDEGIDATTHIGNIQAGAFMISQYIAERENIHLALMVYNCGEGGARELWGQGIYSTAYTRAVVTASEKWAAVLGTGMGASE